MKKYILGLVSGVFILPIMDALLNYICTWIEALKIKPTNKINEWNKTINKNQEECNTDAIGFQCSNNEEYDDYDNE